MIEKSLIFLFFKLKTSYEMRMSDWISDVCSSDLLTSDETPEFTAIEPLIAQLAGDYGVIVRDQIQRQPDNFAAGFPCLAQFNRMRQMRNAARSEERRVG